MKNLKKLPALIMALLMIAVLLAGCGGTSNTAAPESSPPVSALPSAAETASAAPVSPSPVSGTAALDTLMAMEDRLPLGGVQPGHLDSRAGVTKALPFKAHNTPVTIGWCSATQGSAFFTEMVGSAQAAAEKYGYKFNFQVANFDVNAQMTQIESFLTQNVDFLVVNAVDIDATASYYQQAVDKGIPVIVVGPTGGRPEYPIVTTIVASSFETGFVVGEYTAQKLFDQYKNTPIKISFLLSRAGDSDSNSRCCGFVSGYLNKFAELSGTPYPTKWDATLDGYNTWVACRDKGASAYKNIMDLVGYGACGSTDTVAGQPVAADLLTAHPDMDVFFVETATLMPGVMQEISQHGLTAGKDLSVVFGGNGEMNALEAIRNGTALAIGTNAPYYTGAGVVDLIHKIVDEGYDANNLPATSYTPTYCVNIDNVDKYYDASKPFAPMLDWRIQTIDEYNAANG